MRKGGSPCTTSQRHCSSPQRFVQRTLRLKGNETIVELGSGSGFQVEVRDTHALNPIKERLGVPDGKGSCHTAEVAGYVIEGHVPPDDVKRLLAERPDAKGLVLPGMPLGSPGMETPDGRSEAYTVELIANDGTTRAFAQH